MTPLHTRPTAPIRTSYAPLSYAEAVQQWENGAAPGEDRTQAAHQILHAHKTNAAHLDLSNFSTLTILPTLPAGLTTLNLSGCRELTTLPTLPAGLTTLNLSNCRGLTTLPTLPAGLTTLDFGESRELITLQILPTLPVGLTTLNLSYCRELTTLPTLPAGLTTLNLSYCEKLTTLPDLPAGLTWLDLGGSSLTTLPNLPAGLTRLELTGCRGLTTLPNLPAGLTTLNIVGCCTLMTLPNSLPAGLTWLDFACCRSLTALPESLPAGLTSLNLDGCHALTALSAHLPAGLTSLNLAGCRALMALPAHLPAELTGLNLAGCRALMALPEHLPAGLTSLYLQDCHALTTLPEYLPAGLIRLYLEGCHALTLPANLPRHLLIYGYRPPVLTPVNMLTQWSQRAGKPAEYIANLNNEWQKLQGESGFNPFETLIRRLGEPQLLNSVSPGAVLALIESVIQSPDIRRLIFAASAEADANCHDRPLTIFNTVQGLALFATLQREGATPQAILDLAIGMVKQTLLDNATVQVMHQQWQDTRRTGNATGTGPNTSEALEVQLALRHQLGGELGLPFLVNNPLYTAMAQLNDADRAFATKYVNNVVNNKERLTDALLAQPIWQLYLESIIPADTLSVINDLYAERQAQLEQQMVDGSFNDADFLQAINTLMEERQGAIDALFKQKTAELLAQLG